ncbi:MAG: glycogen/starch synthase [Bacteroidales bacterium]|nr:glycogen/starch synthase [Bacteroidales bacterium]
MKLKVLFVTQEITPYMPETEMSLVGRYLPQGIQERDREIRTFLPKFGSINERRNQLHEVIRLSGMNLVIDDTDHPLVIKVASIQPARMQVYFIDNDDFFSRKFALTEKGKEFKDNDERAIFYSRGVIETVKKLGWAPDIIHCHGWFTALVPFYMKKIYSNDPLFDNGFKTIYSVYDDAFSKPLSDNLGEKLTENGVYPEDVSLLANPDWKNLMKFAIEYSDGVIMGSNNVDEEIREYIENGKKPFLKPQNVENYIDKYNEFYDKLIENRF